MPGNPLRELKKRSPSRCPSRRRDRKSTRLNSSHSQISYAVFCLKKKKEKDIHLDLLSVMPHAIAEAALHSTGQVTLLPCRSLAMQIRMYIRLPTSMLAPLPLVG